MCLIIVIPANGSLDKSALSNGWSHNRDGAGYMFARAGELIVRKPFYKLKELRAQLKEDMSRYGSLSPFIIHLRYATHGAVNEMNTHPHRLDCGRVALAHNGILDIMDTWSQKEDKSDTVRFCETVLAFRNPSDLIGAPFRSIMENMIGAANKFVLLDSEGNYSIVNEARGVWDNGNWYSNDGYKPRNKPALIKPARTTYKDWKGIKSDQPGAAQWPDNFKLPSASPNPDTLDCLDESADWQGLTNAELVKLDRLETLRAMDVLEMTDDEVMEMMNLEDWQEELNR